MASASLPSTAGQAILHAARQSRPRLVPGAAEAGPSRCSRCLPTARPYSASINLHAGESAIRSERGTASGRSVFSLAFSLSMPRARSQSNTALHPRGVDTSLFEDGDDAEYAGIFRAQPSVSDSHRDADVFESTSTPSRVHVGPTDLIVQRIREGDVHAATQLARELSELGSRLDPNAEFAVAARTCVQEERIGDALLWLRLLAVPGAADSQLVHPETSHPERGRLRAYQSDKELMIVVKGLRSQFAAREVALPDVKEALLLITKGGFLDGAAYPSFKKIFLTILWALRRSATADARADPWRDYFDELASADAHARSKGADEGLPSYLTDLFQAGIIGHIKAKRPHEALQWLLASLEREQVPQSETSATPAALVTSPFVLRVVVSALIRQGSNEAAEPGQAGVDGLQDRLEHLPEGVMSILGQIDRLGDQALALRAAALQAIEDPSIVEVGLMARGTVRTKFASLLRDLRGARRHSSLRGEIRWPTVRYLLALSDRLSTKQTHALRIAISHTSEGATTWVNVLLARALRERDYGGANAIWERHFTDAYGITHDLRQLVLGPSRQDDGQAGASQLERQWPSHRAVSLMLCVLAKACGGDADKLERAYSMWLDAAFREPPPAVTCNGHEMDGSDAASILPRPDVHSLIQIAEVWIDAAEPSKRISLAFRILSDLKRLDLEPDGNVWAAVLYAIASTPKRLDKARLGTIADGMAMFQTWEALHTPRKVPGLGTLAGTTQLALPPATLKSYLVLIDVLIQRSSTRLASRICAGMLSAAMNNQAKSRTTSSEAAQRRTTDRSTRRRAFARDRSAAHMSGLERYRHCDFVDFAPVHLRYSAPVRALLWRLRRLRMDATDAWRAKTRQGLVRRLYEARARRVSRADLRSKELVSARYAYVAQELRKRDADLVHMDREAAASEWCRRELQVYQHESEAKVSEEELLALPRQVVTRRRRSRASGDQAEQTMPDTGADSAQDWMSLAFGPSYAQEVPPEAQQEVTWTGAAAAGTGGIHDAIYSATFEDQ